MLVTIALSFVASAILLACIVYLSNANWFIKVCILSALLTTGLAGYAHYKDSLGAPIAEYPADGFEYNWHEVTPEGDILIWATTEQRGNRLYRIPYERATSKALEEAKEKKKAGTATAGTFVTREGRPNPRLDMSEFGGNDTGRTK